MGYFEDCKAAFERVKTEEDAAVASLMLEDVGFNALTSAQQAELTALENEVWHRIETEGEPIWAAPV